MEPTLLIIAALALIGFVVWKVSIPSLGSALDEAREKRDVAPLIEAIEKLRPGSRPAAYNHAIRRIWDDYDRELAIELVKELVARHHRALIAQYWIKQALQVEPQLAGRLFSEQFLKQYYQPEVAASCGPVG